jgi:hypothetical protein
MKIIGFVEKYLGQSRRYAKNYSTYAQTPLLNPERDPYCPEH